MTSDEIGGTRGGKGTHFPLLEGSVRATAEKRNLGREYPIILDPMRRADVDCLMFLVDSKACPRCTEDEDAVAFHRTKKSIKILHLNHGRLRKARGQICNQVAEAIERGDLAYRNYLEIRSSSSDVILVAQARDAYDDAIQRLDDFLKESLRYAAAARSVVRQARARKGREWLETLL
jgi:hypothetical protein